MATLLLVEHDNGADPRRQPEGADGRRGNSARPIHALVLGAGSRPAAEAAAKLDGVEKVLLAEDARLRPRPRRADRPR